MMVGVALGHGVGMIGSFLVGSSFGLSSNLPWAVSFPLLGDEVLRHPTQLYEALCYFLIFGLLVWMSSKKDKFTAGIIFFVGLGLQALVRFFVDFYRVEISYIYEGYFTLTIAQALSVCLIVASVFAIIKMYQNNKRDLNGQRSHRTTEEKT